MCPHTEVPIPVATDTGGYEIFGYIFVAIEACSLILLRILLLILLYKYLVLSNDARYRLGPLLGSTAFLRQYVYFLYQ
jgi:hypothetical protein